MGVREGFVVLFLCGLAVSASAASSEPVGRKVGAALRRVATEVPQAVATAGREAERVMAETEDDTHQKVKLAMNGTADHTRQEAERVGRSTAQWLKHAGDAVAEFFRGLGEGWSGPSETR